VTSLFWTPQAREDLQAAYDYIAKDSIRYAGNVVDQLIAAIGRVQQFPESGRVVPELQRADTREVLWRSYRIVYRLTAGRREAQVLTIFRSERLFPMLRSGESGPA
jgi:toxin ParE1/3/4